MPDLHQGADKPPNQPPHTDVPQPAAVRARLIGERVRQARLAANLTQQEVAGQMYSKAYISAVERGTMTPSLAALHFLAERLERPLSYFLGEEVREPPSEAPKAHVSDEEQTAQLPKFTPKIQRVTASGEVTSLGARVTV